MNGSKCKHCSIFIAGSVKKMDVHLVRCEAERPYVCDAMADNRRCGRRFPSGKALGVHRGSFHTAEENDSQYRCQHCSHGSDSAHSLADHQRRCGRGEIRRRSRSCSRGPSMSRSVPTTPRHADDDGNDGLLPFNRPRPTSSAAGARRRAPDFGTPRRSRSPPRPSFARSDGTGGGRARQREASSSSLAPTPGGGARRRSVSKRGDGGAAGTHTVAATPRATVPVAPAPTTPSRRDVVAAAVVRRPSVAAATPIIDDADEQVEDSTARDVPLCLPTLPTGDIDEQGIYQLSLLDPDVARMVMYEQHRSFDDYMDRIGKLLEELKEIVKNRLPGTNIDLSHFDKAIQDYLDNDSAEALEKSGKLNLGIAKRRADPCNNNSPGTSNSSGSN